MVDKINFYGKVEYTNIVLAGFSATDVNSQKKNGVHS